MFSYYFLCFCYCTRRTASTNLTRNTHRIINNINKLPSPGLSAGRRIAHLQFLRRHVPFSIAVLRDRCFSNKAAESYCCGTNRCLHCAVGYSCNVSSGQPFCRPHWYGIGLMSYDDETLEQG
uniref:Secreted protein n=1 Tax=Globodera pallida TaxID=36090 RepID=A0A183CMP9_GLOPA